jgi:DNA repair exonuclease SbcCD ATPase subunit
LTASLVTLSKAFSALETAKQANAVLKGLGVTVTQLQGMLLGLGKYALIIAGVSTAIYVAYKAYKYFLPSAKDLNEEAKKSQQNYADATKEISNLEENLKQVAEQIDNIKSKGKIETTDAKDLKNLERTTAELRIQLALQRQKQAVALAETNKTAQRIASKKTETDVWHVEKYSTASPIGEEAETGYTAKSTKSWMTATEALKAYTTEIENAQTGIEANNQKIAENNELIAKGAKNTNELKEENESLNQQNEALLGTYNKNMKAVGDVSEEVQTLANSTVAGNKEAKEALDTFANVTSTLVTAGDGADGLAVKTQALTDAEGENGEQAGDNADANEALQESLSTVSKAMKPVEKAQKEYAKSGKITSDTIIGIQSKAQKLGLDFTNLSSVLANEESSVQDVNNAFASMLMQIVRASGAFDNLTKDNADLVEGLLEGYGVTNAYSIVQQALADSTGDLAFAFEPAIKSLQAEANAMTNTKIKVGETEYAVNAFAQAIIDSNGHIIDCSADIRNLSALERQAYATAYAVGKAKLLEQYKDVNLSRKETHAHLDFKTGKVVKEQVVNTGYKDDFINSKARDYANNFLDDVRRFGAQIETINPPDKEQKRTGGGGGSRGSSSANNVLEEYKKLYQAEHEELEHMLKMDEISETEYYKRLDALNEKYFGEASGHHQDCLDEYRKNQESIYTWTKDRFKDTVQYQEDLLDRQVEAYQKAQQKMSKALSKQIDALQEDRDDEDEYWEKRIDRQEKLKDATLERLKAEQEAIEKEHNSVVDNIKTEIDALKKQKDENKDYWDDRIKALEKTNDELDKQKQLAEKLEALEKAKSTRVKVFKNGRFVYDVDREAVSQAQKNLNEYKEKLRQEREKQSLQDQKEAEQKNYQDRIDALENYRDQQDKYYDDIEKRLKENYDATEKSYSKIIDALKEKRDKAKKEYDEEIKDLQKYQKEQEEKYQQMVDKLNEFKDKYSDALKNMENAQKGFLDSSKAFTYDFSKSIEENMKALNEFLQMTPEQMQNGAMNGGGRVDSDGGAIRYSNPDEERTARMSSGSSSTPTHSVPDGHGGTAQSTSIADKYGGVVSKHYTIHAKGADSLASDEMAVVGENPNKEIVVGSKLNNGVLMKLSKDSGVVNSKSTRTFAGLLNSLGDSKNLVEHGTNVNQTFHFGNITLPNVTDGNSFARELSQKFNNYAIQYGNIRK